jgi:4'-phosphopantetheinyl transferase
MHVWAASLQFTPAALQALSDTLCPAERRRAARFHLPEHRARFIAGRGLLRAVLSRCLGTEPGRIDFRYGKHGKPELESRFAESRLQFNLAHCENLALIAVAQGKRIGIDVERIRVLPDAGELVTRFFSPRENAAFHALPAAQQSEAFFNLWTRKEAWLKATGDGISRYLAQVEVTFLPGEPARLLSLPESLRPHSVWSLRDLRPAAGFVGALSVQGKSGQVECWRWEPAGLAEVNQIQS